MKKILIITLGLFIALNNYSQGLDWSVSSSNITLTTPTNNVGIGASPLAGYKLSVIGSSRNTQFSGSNWGYVDIVPASGSIELGGAALPFAFIDFKGNTL